MAVVQDACEAGVRAVQLREKDLFPSELYPLAGKMNAVCRATGTKLLVNDRVDVVQAVQADGVQLTAKSLPVAVARGLLGKAKLIGVSTHSLEEAHRAADSGADFVLYGPVFYTSSKAAFGAPKGLSDLTRVAEAVAVPVFAIGGINPDRANRCIEAGASGVAVISSILHAEDIRKAVAEFEDALGCL